MDYESLRFWGILLGIFLCMFLFSKWQEKRVNKRISKLDSIILKANKTHGTKFNSEQRIGLLDSLCFDTINRKLLFISFKGHSLEASTPRIEDFSYIKEWNLTWDSDISSYPKINFTVNDFKQPLWHLRCNSKAEGDQYMAKLNIILC